MRTDKARRRDDDFMTVTWKAVTSWGRAPPETRVPHGIFKVLAPIRTPAKSGSEPWPPEETAHG